MKDLIGRVSRESLDLVNSTTRLRFKNSLEFKSPEALILYEQRMIDKATLFRLCQAEYDEKLYEVKLGYIPEEISKAFIGTNTVPISVDVLNNSIIIGTLPELKADVVNYSAMQVVVKYITVYDYVYIHNRYYGEPEFLNPIPVSDKLNFIYSEAIELGAADITITNTLEGARIYYNVRKRKVISTRSLTRTDVEMIAKIMANRANSAVDKISTKPLYLANRLDTHHRGRICINKNYYGVSISIRVLTDDPLDLTLYDLNLPKNSIDFIQEFVLNKEPGLRLWIGETMSGKNTTIACAISDVAKADDRKIVSVEQPVEILIPNIEQMEVSSELEFKEVVDSLIRQNPDVVYITEMNSFTAREALVTSNTSKIVLSTIHANSISEVPSRLLDLTGLPLDRVIMSLKTCIYQRLIRDEEKDKLYPEVRCVNFDNIFKQELFGKDLHEVQTLIKRREEAWE